MARRGVSVMIDVNESVKQLESEMRILNTKKVTSPVPEGISMLFILIAIRFSTAVSTPRTSPKIMYILTKLATSILFIVFIFSLLFQYDANLAKRNFLLQVNLLLI